MHTVRADSASHSLCGRPADVGAKLSMVLTLDRVVYRGLLGKPAVRSLGALAIYVGLESSFSIVVDAAPNSGRRLAVVEPNVPHIISSPDRVIGVLLIEPECVGSKELQQLTALMGSPGAQERLVRAFHEIGTAVHGAEHTSPAIDSLFLGETLAPRRLDRRVELAIRGIRARPWEHFAAASCARLAGLSFTRFVHLFKEEIGMTFRAYCAWKRARALLQHVSSDCNLTDLAMQTGYPDSTHFSHSIRRIYGLRPKDIVSGSRRLAVVADPCASDLDR